MRKASVLVAGLLTAAMAGCGLQPASQFIPDVEPGSQLDEFDSLDGLEITTTSKDFTEQLVLGKILSLVLQAKGAEVTDETNAKGSINARQAMLRGDADVMWEYTGTAWLVYMGHSDVDPETGLSDGVRIVDPDELFDAVLEEDVAENDIHWADPAPFNNTYAMAVKQDAADEFGLETLEDLAELDPADQTVCLENEFLARSDGWPGMLDAYDLDIPSSQVSIMDAGVVYSQIGDTCVVGEVFDTDGRIPANDLVTLEDNREFFPMYEPAVNIRSEVHDAHPDIAEMFAKIGAQLDTDTMRVLNARVDVDGENPVNVAEDWLIQEGFLSELD